MSVPQFKGTNFKFDVGLVDQVAEVGSETPQTTKLTPESKTVQDWITLKALPNGETKRGTLYKFEVLDFYIEGVSDEITGKKHTFTISNDDEQGAYIVHAKIEYALGTTNVHQTNIYKFRIPIKTDPIQLDLYEVFDTIVGAKNAVLPAINENILEPTGVPNELTLQIDILTISGVINGPITGFKIDNDGNHPTLRFNNGLFYTQAPTGGECKCHINYMSPDNSIYETGANVVDYSKLTDVELKLGKYVEPQPAINEKAISEIRKININKINFEGDVSAAPHETFTANKINIKADMEFEESTGTTTTFVDYLNNNRNTQINEKNLYWHVVEQQGGPKLETYNLITDEYPSTGIEQLNNIYVGDTGDAVSYTRLEFYINNNRDTQIDGKDLYVKPFESGEFGIFVKVNEYTGVITYEDDLGVGAEHTLINVYVKNVLNDGGSISVNGYPLYTYDTNNGFEEVDTNLGNKAQLYVKYSYTFTPILLTTYIAGGQDVDAHRDTKINGDVLYVNIAESGDPDYRPVNEQIPQTEGDPEYPNIDGTLSVHTYIYTVRNEHDVTISATPYYTKSDQHIDGWTTPITYAGRNFSFSVDDDNQSTSIDDITYSYGDTTTESLEFGELKFTKIGKLISVRFDERSFNPTTNPGVLTWEIDVDGYATVDLESKAATTGNDPIPAHWLINSAFRNHNFTESLTFLDKNKKELVAFTPGYALYDSLPATTTGPIIDLNVDAGFTIPVIKDGVLQNKYVRISDIVASIEKSQTGAASIADLADRLHALEVALQFTTSSELERNDPTAEHLLYIKDKYSALNA